MNKTAMVGKAMFGVGQENGEAVLLSSKAKLVYFGIVDKVWTENAQAK